MAAMKDVIFIGFFTLEVFQIFFLIFLVALCVDWDEIREREVNRREINVYLI